MVEFSCVVGVRSSVVLDMVICELVNVFVFFVRLFFRVIILLFICIGLLKVIWRVVDIGMLIVLLVGENGEVISKGVVKLFVVKF